MADRKQPVKQKEMATRPKERRNRGRSACAPAQSDDAVISTLKEDSERLGKYTSPVVDSRSDDTKTPKKKSPKVQQSKKNSADDKDETSHLTIQKNRKQSIKDTPANREKSNGTSSGANDKTAQPTASVTYPLNGLPSATATEKKPLNKLKTSRSLDLGTKNRTKDRYSFMETTDTLQQLNTLKSSDDIHEADGQSKEKVPSKKKVCGKTSKEEEKPSISNLDKVEVEEVKGRRVKTGNSKTSRLKEVVEKLKLKMPDISNASKKVNEVVNRIRKSEQFSNDSLFKGIGKMSTGSYYERLKIDNPNEFDIMLEISLPTHSTIKLTSLDRTGPFYTLAFKDRKPEAMKKYLYEENNISARKIMEEFRNLIKQVISKPGMENVSLQRKDPGSPAVTLIIKNEPQDISVDLVPALKIISNWPEETVDGMKIDDWLGLKVKQQLKKDHFFMVPKQAMNGKKVMDADTWRISTSNIEKRIITNHGHGKTCCESGGSNGMCCRKPCLKLLKRLLELLTNENKRKMDQFCSYHAKTALLHHCADHPKDEEWKFEDLDECFNRYVDYFQACLRKRELPNFFIPLHNLLSEEFVDKSNCDYLYKKIEEQKTNAYPIFYK